MKALSVAALAVGASQVFYGGFFCCSGENAFYPTLPSALSAKVKNIKAMLQFSLTSQFLLYDFAQKVTSNIF